MSFFFSMYTTKIEIRVKGLKLNLMKKSINAVKLLKIGKGKNLHFLSFFFFCTVYSFLWGTYKIVLYIFNLLVLTSHMSCVLIKLASRHMQTVYS